MKTYKYCDIGVGSGWMHVWSTDPLTVKQLSDALISAFGCRQSGAAKSAQLHVDLPYYLTLDKFSSREYSAFAMAAHWLCSAGWEPISHATSYYSSRGELSRDMAFRWSEEKV